MPQGLQYINPWVAAGDAVLAEREKRAALELAAQERTQQQQQREIDNALRSRQVSVGESNAGIGMKEFELKNLQFTKEEENKRELRGLMQTLPPHVQTSLNLRLLGAPGVSPSDLQPPGEEEPPSDYERKLERYAQRIGTTRAKLTQEQENAFVKEQSLLDDRPADPVLTELRNLRADQIRQQQAAGMSPTQFSMADRLHNDFRQESGDFVTRQNQYRVINTVAQNAPSPAGDLSLIFAYMKMLDPISVVREGEQATAANARGVPDHVRNLYNNLITGQRLTPSQRQDFLSNARTQYKSFLSDQNRRVNAYTSKAASMNLPAEFVVDQPDPDLSAEPSPPPAGGQVGPYRVRPVP